MLVAARIEKIPKKENDFVRKSNNPSIRQKNAFTNAIKQVCFFLLVSKAKQDSVLLINDDKKELFCEQS